MGKIRIIKRIINAYEVARNHLRSGTYTMEEVTDYLRSKEMHIGVCNYYGVAYGSNIVGKRWVRKHIKDRHYWCEPPFGKEQEEAIKLLDERLDILKTELANCNWFDKLIYLINGRN